MQRRQIDDQLANIEDDVYTLLAIRDKLIHKFCKKRVKYQKQSNTSPIQQQGNDT